MAGFDFWDVCMRCEKDWSAFAMLLDEAGAEKGATVYGCLGECVVEAFNDDLIPPDHELAQHWVDDDDIKECKARLAEEQEAEGAGV